MIEVRVTRQVRQSPEEVFAYWSDWSNNPKWQTGMISCEWTSEPPLQLGSTYEQTATFLGRQIVSSFKVVDYLPNRLLRIQTTESTMPLDITREVIPRKEGGTTLRATIRGQPKGLLRLFNSLTTRMVTRNVNADYDRLKTLFDEQSA